MIKYKIHEVAKDLNVSSKEVIEVVAKYCGTTKKSMTTLEESELDIVFDYFTQKNNMESLSSYFAVRDKAIEAKEEAEQKRKEEEREKKAQAKKELEATLKGGKTADKNDQKTPEKPQEKKVKNPKN